MKRKSKKLRPVFIYAICDADGLVRYIGQCWDVRKRIRSHIWSNSAAGKWMRSEVARGKLPIVQTLMQLRAARGVGDGVCRWAGNALETWAIRYYQKNQSGELLNVAGIVDRQKCFYAHKGYSLPKCPEVKMRWTRLATGYERRKARVEARKMKVETA